MSLRELTIKCLVLLTLVLSIGGCDHLSKDIATGSLAGTPTQSFLFDTVRLSYAENPGSFLSLGAGLPELLRFAVFTIGTGVLLIALVAHALRSQWRGLKFLGVALIAAGGVANWADRAADGRVVDFLNVGIGPVRTGIFNIADVAIMTGAVLVLVGQYWQARRECRNT